MLKNVQSLPFVIKSTLIIFIFAALSIFNLYRVYNRMFSNVKAATDEVVKPIIKGLLLRNGAPPETHRSIINTRVLNVGWKDLQASQSSELTENNPIDQVIEEVQSQNLADSTLNMRIKLRIFAGIEAPDWLKNLEGSPITISDAQDATSGTIGRFWTTAFGQAYQELQNKLAAKYDSVPEILDVTISRCMTIYAEPFIRNASNTDNRTALLNAGFTFEADKQCHREQIEAHNVWTQTRTSLAFNPYQEINQDGSYLNNEAFTEEMMEYCRTVLGIRCVLENNSIRTPLLGGDYIAMYAKMKALGPPLFYQTAREWKIGDWKQTVQWAIDQGANAVELNNDTDYYFTTPTIEELVAYDATLEASLDILPAPTPTNTPTPTSTPSPTAPASLTPMTVKSMSMSSIVINATTNKITTRVVIKNSITGAVLPGARVYVTLTTSSGIKKFFNALTNTNGAVNFSYQSTEKGTFTSKVTKVVKDNYTYNSTITQRFLTIN